MVRVSDYSINPKLKNVSFDRFKKMVKSAFKLLPEKDREKAMKEAYENQYGKDKTNSKKSTKDKDSEDSRIKDIIE